MEPMYRIYPKKRYQRTLAILKKMAPQGQQTQSTPPPVAPIAPDRAFTPQPITPAGDDLEGDGLPF